MDTTPEQIPWGPEIVCPSCYGHKEFLLVDEGIVCSNCGDGIRITFVSNKQCASRAAIVNETVGKCSLIAANMDCEGNRRSYSVIGRIVAAILALREPEGRG